MRFTAAALMFLLLACARTTPDWKLPAEIEGGWKLGVLPPSPETYGLVKLLSPKKSMMAGYEGPGTLRVAAFELASGQAFERVQHWQVQPGKIAFAHGRWFIVLECATLDASQLSRIAALLEKTMP